MRNFLTCITLLIFIFSCNTDRKTDHNKTIDTTRITINQLGNRYLELNRFSGVILVSRDSNVIYSNSFGLADYENNKPFTESTTFKIGEISELITAGLLAKLENEGKLSRSDKVSEYVPGINSDLTISDLINHKTGFPAISTISENNPSENYSTVAFTNLVKDTTENSVNSDLDYNLLGLVIENVTGKSFQKNIEDYNNDLGLKNTYFIREDTNLATGYLYHNYRGNGPELQIAPSYNPDIAFSSRGIKSTAEDLVKCIGQSSADSLSISGYIENDGFSYSVYKELQTQTIIVVLSNRRHPVSAEITNSITSILHDEEYELPLLKKPVDIDTKLFNEYAGVYSLNENMMIEVVKEADSLFVMLGPNKTALIPQSNNQFYMEQGDAAIRFLRDSTNVVNGAELLNGFLTGPQAIKVK
ncbi:serine hydrolase [Mangrovivirga sp. M17]|uniref:Serine hydrolase n=1 Tax=Mangrovivirga halotolerans TaxID=2993936 RepID=A0ABT3RWH7_9BACT|nr:serine hydrolase domain-containing protein [Mangrovivirga halotolerans]MCX2745510.1 serine hydrolase [Mangrovivirga halotolerans]